MQMTLHESEAVIERTESGTAYKLRAKPITTARKAPDEQQLRDTFQTPSYAIRLLIPFIPKNITHVWECAAGGGIISRNLEKSGYTVFESDIWYDRDGITPYNFVNDMPRTDIDSRYAIITNPPFSIKDMFVERCFDYGRPFALLINADYSNQSIDWVKRGCEKIIPTSRIAYITPNVLRRIHEGEAYKEAMRLSSWSFRYTMEQFKTESPEIWEKILRDYEHIHNYNSIEDVPQELLYKYSNAQFHSMWLTYGFNLGKTETFVDLSVSERKGNIL